MKVNVNGAVTMTAAIDTVNIVAPAGRISVYMYGVGTIILDESDWAAIVVDVFKLLPTALKCSVLAEIDDE